MSLLPAFGGGLEQVAKLLGRDRRFQPNSALLLNFRSFWTPLMSNHSMSRGLGDEYTLICDLIHISHEWELGLEGVSSSFWFISPCPHRLAFFSTGTQF